MYVSPWRRRLAATTRETFARFPRRVSIVEMAEPDRAAMALKSGYDGSVQGVDGRRYRVDEDASAYYDEIAAALEACDARARAAESEDVAAEAAKSLVRSDRTRSRARTGRSARWRWMPSARGRWRIVCGARADARRSFSPSAER